MATRQRAWVWLNYLSFCIFISVSTCALLVTSLLAQNDASAPSRNRAYFNSTLNSQVTLPTSILNLRGHIAFSFRTCSPGTLVQQSGGTSGDSIQYSLTSNGQLRLSWIHAGESDSVTIPTESLLTNEWFTIETKFSLGQMHLSAEKGATILKKELISNSTLRRFLWDLDLSGGSGIVVGSGFTGGIQEGPGVQLSLQSAVPTAEVRWGECPLEDSVYPSCGKFTNLFKFTIGF